MRKLLNAGKRRLRKVAKMCVNYGQRVQNSVFECLLDASQYAVFKAKLLELVDPKTDSLRFYQLGNNYRSSPLFCAVNAAFPGVVPCKIQESQWLLSN